jgi:hypothetical protein
MLLSFVAFIFVYFRGFMPMAALHAPRRALHLRACVQAEATVKAGSCAAQVRRTRPSCAARAHRMSAAL